MVNVLAIDAGGTTVKAAIYGLDGREMAVAGEVMAAAVPTSGWAERDLATLWAVVRRCARRALHEAGTPPGEIAAVGLTGYGNGLLLLDRAGHPVRPAILATDGRAAAIVEEWQANGLEHDHVRLTHQRLWPGKPLPLLAWLAKHEPDALARAACVLTCKDYLRYRLTGRLNMEVSDASTSSLFDHASRRFTPAVLQLLGLDRFAPLFPPMLEPLDLAGAVTREAAQDLGLAPGTPVSAGYADGPAMLLGLGIRDDTLVNVVAGTWGLNQVLTRTPTTDGSILAASLGILPGEYILIDGGATSASAFEWFVGAMHPGVHDHATLYEHYNREIAALGPERPSLLFLPYLAGRTDAPAARGTFFGLSAEHGLADMARAIFEGVAMEHRTHVDALFTGRPRPRAVRFAGGAARSRPWLDIFAAALAMPIELGGVNETGALGAAIVAATGARLHPDIGVAVRHMVSVKERIDPNPQHLAVMVGRSKIYQTLRDALRPLWPAVAGSAIGSAGSDR